MSAVHASVPLFLLLPCFPVIDIGQGAESHGVSVACLLKVFIGRHVFEPLLFCVKSARGSGEV